MQTLHLAGYHDVFRLEINKLKHLPCFSPGTVYLVEIPINTCADLFIDINKKLKYCSDDDLPTIKKELKAGLLGLGLNDKITANISDLIDTKPKKIIPISTNTPKEPTVYGSKRDKETLILTNEAVINLSEDNVTFLGGGKHAKYKANELEHPQIRLYDFRPEQIPYNPKLQNFLKAKGII